MSDIQELIDALVAFRDERDWAQFHDSKNLAAAIGIEAAELNELFLWKTIKESEGVDRERLKEELADVLAYALLLAHKHDIDVKDAVLEKIAKNAAKYPVEKARGTAAKYDQL
jgi:NTP pyrophosphatase (non-canonical NTP hydrolase)